MANSQAYHNAFLLRQIVSPVRYGFRSSASAAVNAAAIQAAIDALGGTNGGEVRLPLGEFNVAPDVIKPVTRNVRIRGMGPGMSYDGASVAGTRLFFTGGAVAIDFTTWAGASSGGFYELADLSLDGADLTDRGLWANGQILVDNVTINNFEIANIDIYDLCNSSRLQNFSAGGGAGIGLLIGSASGGSNTTISVENFNCRQNVTGIRLVNSRGFSFKNGVVESNTGAGLEIYQPTGGQVNNGRFEHVWFEENRYSGGAGYQATIEAQTVGDRATSIDFVHCAFEATAPTDAINVVAGEYIRLIDCDYTTGADITFGADTYRCGSINHSGTAHVEGTVGDSGSENYIGIIDESGPQLKTITVPSFTATLTGCTTAPTYTVNYVKQGNLVTLEIPEVSGTSNDTTKTLTGLPAALQPTTLKQLPIVACIDNGVGPVMGLLRVSGGVISYFASVGGAAFTAAGAFTGSRTTITYSIA